MRAFLALLPAYTLSIFYRSFLSVIAPPLMADLNMNPAQFSFLGAIWFIVFALAQFPVGYALDRIGPQLTAAVPLAIGTVGGIVFALAPSYPVALIGMALIGVGCSPALMSALYLFARTEDPARFGLLASLFIGIGSLGNLFGAAPLARLAEAFGWRPAMLAVAGIMGLATLVAYFAIRNPAAVRAADGTQAGWLDGLRGILSIRPLWLLMPILFISYGVLATTRGLWVGPYLMQAGGLDQLAAGDGAFLMALTMCIGAVAYGFAEERTGRRKALVMLGAITTAALYLGLALTPAGGGRQAVILLALIGALGITYAILMAHARSFFPPDLIGRGVTFVNFVIIGGTAALQAWSGRLVAAGHVAGVPAVEIYRDMHLAFAAVLAASAVVYAFAPADPKPVAPRPATPSQPD